MKRFIYILFYTVKNISFKRRKIFFIFYLTVLITCNFLLLTCSCFAQPIITDWVRLYPDTNSFVAAGNILVLDDSGNVYIAGNADSSSHESNCTVKYSASGVRQWAAEFYGPYFITSANAIAIDNLSNIYITGYSNNGSTFFDYCTIKYNSNGVFQWVRYYDDYLHGEDEGQKIAVDKAGNIYVSGYTQVSGGGFVYTTIKYSTDGRELWVRSYPLVNQIVLVNGIAVDDSCNVYITGDYVDESLTVKYDSSGNQLWAQGYLGMNGRTGAKSLALDKYNNVYITGFSSNLRSSFDYFTIKYTSAGTQEWAMRYSLDSTYSDNQANSIVADNIGCVYVSGFTRLNSTSDLKSTIVKYSNSGALQWAQTDSSRMVGQNSFMDIDKNKNIYISVSTLKPPFTASFTIIKYDSIGIKKWENYDVSGIGPSHIKVDDNFNIYLTARAYTVQKMCTVKYSQPPIGIIGNNNQIPERFKLFQNYPNPFNPATNFEFRIADFGFASIKIYDVLGREILTLVNENKLPGIYKVEWDAKELPSGVYFYRLVVTQGTLSNSITFIETRKMILIK